MVRALNFYNFGVRHVPPELLDAVMVPRLDDIVEELDHLRLLLRGHIIRGDVVGVLFDGVNAKGWRADLLIFRSVNGQGVAMLFMHGTVGHDGILQTIGCC